MESKVMLALVDVSLHLDNDLKQLIL